MEEIFRKYLEDLAIKTNNVSDLDEIKSFIIDCKNNNIAIPVNIKNMIEKYLDFIK